MFEMKINVEVTATEIVSAINNLADVIGKIGTPVITSIVTKAEPVNPEPVQAAPQPVQQAAPQPAPVAPVQKPQPVPTAAPMPTPTPAPQPVQQAAPEPQQKAITIDMLAAAGAPLVDQGKMPQLMALLAKYGVQAITQLTPDKYDAFATDLRAIGAQI